jgi:hypothetical protein
MSEEDFGPDGPDTELTDRGGVSVPRVVVAVAGVALLGSLVGNGYLLARGPKVVTRTESIPVLPPPQAPCPVCPTPAPCPTCPTCETPDASVRVASGPRAPRVNEALAAEGEGEVERAATAAERDPVQLAAQRTVANGVDRIVSSRSPAAVQRFFQRTLPAFASMECAFRDPASAEHVRMQLRPMNNLLPVNQRLTEQDLLRFERDLRCPRE